MAEFLSFADGELRDLVVGEVFRDSAVDLRRTDEINGWHVRVAVVFHHAGIDDLRESLSIKAFEILFR